MNLIDSAFLCLDIGTCGVRGAAHRVKNATICNSAYYALDDFDTVFALKSVIDELEKQIGSHFDTAYITGNFGLSFFTMAQKNTVWDNEHKITASDIKSQIASIEHPEGFYPMHIIPLRYDTPHARNLLTPVGHSDRQLISVFSGIFFDGEYMKQILDSLRHAHIQSDGFYAPHFLENSIFNVASNQTLMFIDFGAESTTTSIWTGRGPIYYNNQNAGGNDLTRTISNTLHLSFTESERIKRAVADLRSNEMARFSPADTAYAFSCADINEQVVPFYIDLVEQIKSDIAQHIEKYPPAKIIVTGGGARIAGLQDLLSETFDTQIEICPVDTTVRALTEYIWKGEESHRKKYLARIERWQNRTNKILRIFHRKTKKKSIRFVPIMPSTMCFDMNAPETYTMFYAGGISAIHVDIMDGLYVNKIAGSIEELKHIRASWPGRLHVHLMTEAPAEWARAAISAGADTIILSTNTAGLRAAVGIVRDSGKRVGIALNPESSVSLLKTILRDLDEVMIMAVRPGAAGQKFDPAAIDKIKILNTTRKKYGLKFVISVDGGINADTAKMCWDAGADILVSGSYLAHQPDFPLAVQSLVSTER